MGKATVAISQDFFNSFAALPKSKQNKVMEFLSKFRSNPEANGFNYEKIQNASDPNMRSVRIDDTYRAILIREEGTNVYLLLWVDHHDEAYDWAVRKRCILNHTTGSIQVYETQATAQPDEQPSSEEKPLFDGISDELLQKLGVPEEQIAFVRILTETSFDGAKDGGWNDCVQEVIIDENASAEHTVEVRMAAGSENKGFTILAFGYTK